MVGGGCDLPPEPRALEGPRVLSSDPEDGAQGVDRAKSVRVRFDRALAPEDVHRGNVALVSGARSAFLAPRFDPVDHALLLDIAGEPLDPNVLWRVELGELRDLELAPMEPVTLSFRTGDQAVGDPPLAAPSFADVAPIFERCASAGCHAGPDAVLGLDLSSAEAIRRTAVGIAAEQVRVGVEGERPWDGADGLFGLARIDVAADRGNPAQSYLLYKVLGDPHIAGARMPPAPAAPLSEGELRALADWILVGAPSD
jgi:hypothetical protein